MGNLGRIGRIGYGFAAALVVALAPAPAIALADEPSSPDPTVMDVVDSVLSESPQPAVAPPADDAAGPSSPGGVAGVALHRQALFGIRHESAMTYTGTYTGPTTLASLPG
jgi:hypothetical protein